MQENISLSLEEAGRKSEFHLTSSEINKAWKSLASSSSFPNSIENFCLIFCLLFYVDGEFYMFALFLYIGVNLSGDAKFKH